MSQKMAKNMNMALFGGGPGPGPLAPLNPALARLIRVT